MSGSGCLCFANLGALNVATPPHGTLEVIIDAFAAGAEVANAIYIPAPGNKYPGHPLSGQDANGNWWTIHPDHVTLEAAGAPSDVTADCGPAMQNVFKYSTIVPQTKLRLGARDYLLQTFPSVTYTSSNTGGLSFSILGSGIEVSRLVVPYSTEVEVFGAFAITWVNPKANFVGKDFSVIATGATASGQSCGTAISLSFPTPYSQEFFQVVLRDIKVSGDGHVDDAGNSYSYFNIGVFILGASRPFVFGTTVTGSYGSDPDDLTPGSLNTQMAYALYVQDCYEPYIAFNEFWHGACGVYYYLDTNAPKQQAFIFHHNQMNGFLTGLQVSPDGGDLPPDGFVINNYVAFGMCGFNISNITKWRFDGNRFNALPGAPEGQTIYDMYFTGSAHTIITGSQCTQITNANRICLFIDGNSERFNVAKNQFGETDLHGDPIGISAVRIAAGATQIELTDNDNYGIWTGPVIDDQSGAAVVRYTSAQYTNPPPLPFTSTFEAQPIRSGSSVVTGPTVELYANVLAGSAASDVLGAIQFSGNEPTLTKAPFAAIQATVVSPSGAASGGLNMVIQNSGLPSTVFSVTPGSMTLGAAAMPVLPAANNSQTLGSSSEMWANSYVTERYYANGVVDLAGNGAPTMSAQTGSTYRNYNPTSSAGVFYVMKATGWFKVA